MALDVRVAPAGTGCAASTRLRDRDPAADAGGQAMRHLLIPLAVALLVAVPLGFAFVHWSKGGPGSGLCSRHWTPDPAQGYWDPRVSPGSRWFFLDWHPTGPEKIQ